MLGSGKCRAAVVLIVMFCVCVCMNDGLDLLCGLDACLIRVICVNCGIICYASVVPAMFVLAVCCGYSKSPALVMSVSKWGCKFHGYFASCGV